MGSEVLGVSFFLVSEVDESEAHGSGTWAKGGIYLVKEGDYCGGCPSAVSLGILETRIVVRMSRRL